MNQCGASRDANIMEDLYTWCGTAACANACMCLLKSFTEKMAFVWRCWGD